MGFGVWHDVGRGYAGCPFSPSYIPRHTSTYYILHRILYVRHTYSLKHNTPEYHGFVVVQHTFECGVWEYGSPTSLGWPDPGRNSTVGSSGASLRVVRRSYVSKNVAPLPYLS